MEAQGWVEGQSEATRRFQTHEAMHQTVKCAQGVQNLLFRHQTEGT